MKKSADTFEAYLVDKGFLKKEQLEQARSKRAVSKQKFKAICLQMGFMSEEHYAEAEAEFLEMPYVDLKQQKISSELIKTIPSMIAKRDGVIPISKQGNILTVAVFDPYNIFTVDELEEATNLRIKLTLATEKDIWIQVRHHYDNQAVADTAKTFKSTRPTKASSHESESVQFQLNFRKLVSGGGEDAPVVRLVDQMIMQAVEDKASDIHIEPEVDFLRVRNRIDGVLIEVNKLDKDIQSPIISRIKIMAKLDIAERRKPQDGKIQTKVNGNEVDIRVSSYPTAHGENVVMRILDHSNSTLDLDQLGFSVDLMKQFKKLLHAPYGVILVTGPTGAGKTTTLYAALQAINTVDKNIMTIEDPIEYQIPMIRQSQVNPKAGLTFASGLRSLLRQDPDVMLIGEIRDQETAEIAVESALTGHLVFSTLHTNDSASAITRLQDMGVETFLITSSVIGIVAQRLVRSICSECKKKVPITQLPLSAQEMEELTALARNHSSDLADAKSDVSLYVGEGCDVCKNTGFRGRLSIYELLTIDDSVRELISKRVGLNKIRSQCFEGKNLTMRQFGFLRALQGATTLEEVLKAVQSD